MKQEIKLDKTKLYCLMAKKGVATFKQLSTLTGVGAQTITNGCTGKMFGVKSLAKLSNYFGVDPEELITNETEFTS